MSNMPIADIFSIGLTGLLAVVGFLAVFVLNSIKSEIRDIKKSLIGLEKDMRDGVGGLDRRITYVEAHLQENGYHRRKDNGQRE